MSLFRNFYKVKETNTTQNAALVAELERLKIENRLLRQQLEGKIYDL